MTTLTHKRITKAGNLVEFTYSECDQEIVDGHNWRSDNGYIITTVNENGKRVTKRFHRLVMGDPKGKSIDHIDGNPSNNTRENLRECTTSQNGMNRCSFRNSKSGHKGVYYVETYKRHWRAQIRINKKLIHLGYFETIDEAIQARKEAEIKYFGEFRRKDES